MRVTNKSRASLGFPCNTLVDPGQSADVDDAHLDHPVVAGWVEEGKIEIGSSEEAAPDPAPVATPRRGRPRKVEAEADEGE